jgi:hypothetical protein
MVTNRQRMLEKAYLETLLSKTCRNGVHEQVRVEGAVKAEGKKSKSS